MDVTTAIINSFSNLTASSNDTCESFGIVDADPDKIKGLTVTIILFLSLFGNICTILMLSKFKVHRVPDVLVIGLALTDIITTLIPIPMSTYAYFWGVNFKQGCFLCKFFGTVAQTTRYSSALLVTLVALERYFAVNRPFIYRKYATPRRFVYILICCWIIAFILAVIPIIGDNTVIVTHEGFCLFDIASYYAIGILVYSAIQYVTVFLCFLLVTIELVKVYRRRRKLKVREKYNSSNSRDKRRVQVTFSKTSLTSRISDLGKSLKKAAPLISEKFQWSVEAQFARMLFAVVTLFYITWTTIVVLIIIAQVKNSGDGLETGLFWGIRFSIISTAINPFLYGLLARQYRLAYIYVLRLWLSKCCYWVSPPLKDVFAASRYVGEKTDVNRARNSTFRRNSDGNQSSGFHGSYRNHDSSLAHAPTLKIIQEDVFIEPSNESSNTAELSTIVASTGEVSSSASFPFQAREHNNDSTIVLEIRDAPSMQDLMDSGMVELGPSMDAKVGVENPLAVMTKVVGGEEVIISPTGSELDSSNNTSPTSQFSNPMYEITEISSGHSMKSTNVMRQNRLSSSDDITLVSKKKVTKTRSSEIPYQSTATQHLVKPSHSIQYMSNLSTHYSQPYVETIEELTSGELRGRDKAVSDRTSPIENGRRKEGFVRITNIDTGVSVLAASCGHLTDLSRDNHSILHRSHATAERNSESKLKHKSLDFDCLEVQRLMNKTMFSSPKTYSQQSTANDTQSHSHPHPHPRAGYQNSTENSDSGRESMVLESDGIA